MDKRKWIWRGVIGVIVVYVIIAAVGRHVNMKRLGHDIRYGSDAAKVAAVQELMKRDRLFDRVQQMPKSARIEVLDTVEELSGELAIKQTLVLLKDPEEDVRKRVTKALNTIAKDRVDLLVPAMKDSDENVRNGAKDALVAIGPKVIPQVKAAVPESDLRAAALDVLIRLEEASVPAVVDLLRHEEQDVRMAAADALGKIGSMSATAALIKATTDTAAVRRIAISSLCTICDPRATDLFVQVLSGTADDGEVRARAARALSVIGGPKPIATLTAALDDWDLKVRTSVITGLQRLGGPAVQPVLSAMSSGSQEVRRAGAQVLEKINTPAAAAALSGLARDPDPFVRASAAHGLGVQTSGSHLNQLLALLGDSDGRVADAASESLALIAGRGRQGEVVSSLVAVLRESQPNEVKLRAADSLASVGRPAVSALEAALESGGSAARWSAYALAKTGDPGVKRVLEKYREAADPDLAAVVQRALARM